MNYDCKQLTEAIIQSRDKIGTFNDLIINRKVAGALNIKEDINSQIEPILNFLDPEKYSEREELAKKYDLAFVGNLSGGIFYGERKESDPLRGKFIIYNKDGAPNIYCDKFFDTNQGTYLISIKHNWSIIDSTGIEISLILTDPKFIPNPPNFGEDSQPVFLKTEDKYCFLCPNGKIIIEHVHSWSNPQFSQNRVWIDTDGSGDLYNNNGELLFSAYFDSITTFENNIAIARIRHKYSPDYDRIIFYDLDGRAREGYINIDNKAKMVRTGDIIESELDGETIYFNTRGNIFEYAPKNSILICSDPPLFHQGLENGNYKILDINGNPIVNEEFNNDSIDYYYEGLVFVYNKNRKYACYDTSGQIMFGGKEFRFASGFINGHAMVYDDGGGYLIDKNGRDLFHDKRYKELDYDRPRNTYTCIESTGGADSVSYVDKNGNLRFDKLVYNDLDPNE